MLRRRRLPDLASPRAASLRRAPLRVGLLTFLHLLVVHGGHLPNAARPGIVARAPDGTRRDDKRVCEVAAGPSACCISLATRLSSGSRTTGRLSLFAAPFASCFGFDLNGSAACSAFGTTSLLNRRVVRSIGLYIESLRD